MCDRSARHRRNTSDAPCRFCASCVDSLAHALVECPAHHQARSRWRQQTSGRRILSLHTLFSTDPAVNTARNIGCQLPRVRCDLSCRNFREIFRTFVLHFRHVVVILASYIAVAVYGDPVTSCFMCHFLTITHARSKTSLSLGTHSFSCVAGILADVAVSRRRAHHTVRGGRRRRRQVVASGRFAPGVPQPRSVDVAIGCHAKQNRGCQW